MPATKVHAHETAFDGNPSLEDLDRTPTGESRRIGRAASGEKTKREIYPGYSTTPGPIAPFGPNGGGAGGAGDGGRGGFEVSIPPLLKSFTLFQ